MLNKTARILIFTVLSTNAYAQIEQDQQIVQRITISQEQCYDDFKSLITKYCPRVTSELKEIQKDSFHMRTQAENSYEEWAMYISFQNYYRAYRHFEYDDSDPGNDKCYTTITCID